MTKLKIDTNSIDLDSNLKKKSDFRMDPKHKKYATGKRKTSIARVWINAGTGRMIVNQMDIFNYFKSESSVNSVMHIFNIIESQGRYDVVSTVKGGGFSGQVGALLHGIAKALNQFTPELHKKLREAGLLTRDSRVVERKKYGRHKARKSTQFSKR
jgi:small subunit ribosomal protein S9